MPLRTAWSMPVGRGADDLGDAVGAVGHGCLLLATGDRADRGGSCDRSDVQSGHGPGPAATDAVRITTAAASRERRHRRAGSAATSSRWRIRTVCFVGAILVGPGWLRWVLIAAARAAAVRRRGDGQRRAHEVRRTSRSWTAPTGSPGARHGGHGFRQRHAGTPAFDYPGPPATIRGELCLPRLSSRCRTASPVVVRHPAFRARRRPPGRGRTRRRWTRTSRPARAKGCQRAAVWALLWNNPKLHTPDRRKIWLACDEHRESLADFLARAQLPQRRRAGGRGADDPGPG